MPYIHKFRQSVVTDIATYNALEVSISADDEIKKSVVIPASSTNFVVNIAFEVALLKSIWLQAGGALTIKTNNSTTPQETIALESGKPNKWNTSDPAGSIPFSGVVTKFYVTNAATEAVTLEIHGLVDATPST